MHLHPKKEATTAVEPKHATNVQSQKLNINTDAVDLSDSNSGASFIPPKLDFQLLADKASSMQNLKRIINDDSVVRKHLKTGQHMVFGTGSLDAEIMFIGEAPVREDLISGIPFQGSAGELLNKILKAMLIERDSIYLAHSMLWPTVNAVGSPRTPKIDELEYCKPYLTAQIMIVKPKVIIALGKSAMSVLLPDQTKVALKENRGVWKSFDKIPLLTTYHPSYLIHNDTKRTKRVFWEDMLSVMDRVGMSISEKQRNYFK